MVAARDRKRRGLGRFEDGDLIGHFTATAYPVVDGNRDHGRAESSQAALRAGDAGRLGLAAVGAANALYRSRREARNRDHAVSCQRRRHFAAGK